MLSFFFYRSGDHRDLHSFPTLRSSDLEGPMDWRSIVREMTVASVKKMTMTVAIRIVCRRTFDACRTTSNVALSTRTRSEEHTSELQSHVNLVCRLLLEKKKKRKSRRLK